MLASVPIFVMPMMAALGLAAAVPKPDPARLGTGPKEFTVTAYSDIDWLGRETKFKHTVNNGCHSIEGDKLNDRVNSVKIPDGVHCKFFQSGRCTHHGTDEIYAPGAKAVWDYMNGRISSFQCWHNPYS